MILLPAELSERLNPQPALHPALGATGVVNTLDSEMTDILANKKLSPEVKWRKYGAALNRYMHFVNENRKPLKLPIVTEPRHQDVSAGEETETEKNSEDAADNIRSTLLAVVPKTFKNSAKALYDRLSTPQARSVLSWDHNGRVSVKGVVIPESNIVDFVSDLTRFRKTFNPAGWTTFAQALGSMHLPTDLIGNKKYLAVIQGQHGSGLTSFEPRPPSLVHHAPRRPTLTGRRTPTRRHARAKRAARPPTPHRKLKRTKNKADPFVKWTSFRFR